LFLEIDPATIDINVHPTKTEIKFEDERTVYAVIRSAVKQALGAHQVMPALDFSMDVNFQENWTKNPQVSLDVDREYSYKTYNTPEFQRASVSGWERLFEGDSPASISQKSPGFSAEDQELLTFQSRASAGEVSLALRQEAGEGTGTTFQVERSYIVAQMSTGLLIVDQQLAHERILYERYLKQLQTTQGASQQCLFPTVLTLNPADFALVMDMLPELVSLGFQVDEFGKDTVVIRGVPAETQVKNEKELFEGLIEQYKNFKNELSLDKKENLARSLAKRSCLKKGQKLDAQEMETLVGQLFACPNPNYSPSGNKTFVKLDLTSIHAFFAK
jgi:DNA mismatch repair protein MutL